MVKSDLGIEGTMSSFLQANMDMDCVVEADTELELVMEEVEAILNRSSWSLNGVTRPMISKNSFFDNSRVLECRPAKS